MYIPETWPSDVFNKFNEWLSYLKENTSDENFRCRLRYVAFYALCIYARRMNRDLLGDLLPGGEMPEEFKKFISHKHILLECKARSEVDEDTFNETETLIKIMNNQPGVIMLYADMITGHLEGESKLTDPEKYLQKALDYMVPLTEENELTMYPKAYILRAKLYAALGEYEEALKSVRTGIKKQKERKMKINESDYIERLAEFYDCRVTIEVAEQIGHLDEVQEKVEKQEKRNVGILGIYTGLVSLIMGAMKVNVEGESSLQTFASFIGLFGCLMIVFSMFYLLLYGKSKRRNADESFIMKAFPIAGVIMVAGSLLLLPDRPESLMIVIGVFAVVLGVSFILYHRIRNNSSEGSSNSNVFCWSLLIIAGFILIICGNIANITGWEEIFPYIRDCIK